MTQKCPHLNCLVYHPDGVCGCGMEKYCSQCQQKPSGDVILVKDIHSLIQKAREEAAKESKEKTIEEAIRLSDKIEMEAGPTVFAEWRAFKRFRNTLRDSLK